MIQGRPPAEGAPDVPDQPDEVPVDPPAPVDPPDGTAPDTAAEPAADPGPASAPEDDARAEDGARAEGAPVAEEAPEGEDVAAVGEAPVAEDTPATPDATVADDGSVADDALVAPDAPVTDDGSVADDALVAPDAPGTDDASRADEGSVAEGAPGLDVDAEEVGPEEPADAPSSAQADPSGADRSPGEAAESEAGLAEGPAPEPETSEAVTPEPETPEAKAPEPETSEAMAPELETSEAMAPELETSEAMAPEPETPETKAPEVESPEPESPEVGTAEAPSLETPAREPAADASAVTFGPAPVDGARAGGDAASDGPSEGQAADEAPPESASPDEAPAAGVVESPTADATPDEAPAADRTATTDETERPEGTASAEGGTGDAADPAPGTGSGPTTGAALARGWEPLPWTRPQADPDPDTPTATRAGADEAASGAPATPVADEPAPVTRSSVLGGRTSTTDPATTDRATPDRVATDDTSPGDAPTQRVAPVPVEPAVAAAAAAVDAERPRTTAPDEPRGPEPRPLGSPMDVFPDEDRGPRRWPRNLGIALAAFVVLAGVYVGALWLLSDRVPPGTTVAGVDIGAMTARDAVDHLSAELAGAVVEPVPVSAGEMRTTFDPVAGGLSLDADATVARVTGFGLEPVRLWHQVFGAGAVDPVVDVDETAFVSALDSTAAALATEPVDGTVVFVDGAPSGTDAAEGREVDVEDAADVLTTSWLTAPRPIELPTEVLPPAIDDAEVDRALTEEARPLASAPVVVAIGDERVELPVDVVTTAASFVPDRGSLELTLDGAALVDAVLARTDGLLDEPTDARFVFTDSGPEIEAGVSGTTIDPDLLAAAVATAGTGSDRTARVDLVERTPEVTTADLEELGVVEVVSEFKTPLTSDSHRTQNLIAGTAAINGTLVLPGETFSLTEALGPIDGAHGYVQSGAIVSGRHTNVWGGGLSQVSTTVFNAAFLAGMELVEHQPHSEWFRRYPEGREATLYTGVIDLKWQNNTPYGALVQAWVSGGQTWVRLWGTEHWEVQHSTSGRSNVRSPTTIYDTSAGCTPQSAGNPGFRVTVSRTISLDGQVADEESWTHTYRPQNRIVCGAEPSARDDDDDDDEDED